MNYIDINGGNKHQKILTEEIIKWCIGELESKFDEIACELGVNCSDLWEDFENYHSAKYAL